MNLAPSHGAGFWSTSLAAYGDVVGHRWIILGERFGSPTPGQGCLTANRDAIPAFGAAGLILI
jgi:hypothetical protein